MMIVQVHGNNIQAHLFPDGCASSAVAKVALARCVHKRGTKVNRPLRDPKTLLLICHFVTHSLTQRFSYKEGQPLLGQMRLDHHETGTMN